ncbi:MAG: GTP-binding protein [Lentisphaerae bacterium GWF2_49_21]|nr:MAG: GTP-binding protein [Lentisphaerae bacterium GWF2_49_21]
MYKQRSVSERLRKLTGSFPVVVLSGARQVGKSTLLKNLFPDMPSVIFDPSTDVGNARREPELFLDNHPPPVILDEIQYAPELVSAIKRRIDGNKKPGQYILTGSQQWSVMKNLSESLAGRAVFLDLNGFSMREIAIVKNGPNWLERWLSSPKNFIAAPPSRIKQPRTLYEQIWRGWLPEADSLSLELIPDFHNSYLRTYIERDVRLFSDVNDLQQFGRFIRLAAALTSQEVNCSHLGRDIGVTPQTAQRWLAILSSTFQWFQIPSFSGNTTKRISGKEKGYLSDTGLACMLQMLSSPQSLSGHPLTGALFETAVLSEIRKLSVTMPIPPYIYHWRSHGGAEVDLILERDGIFFPIEVKLTGNPRRDDAKGILAFRKTYPKLKISPGLVISPTHEFSKITENDYSLPWDTL